MNLARPASALAALLVAAPVLTGCGDSLGAESGQPQVVASFYPLEYVAERVAGERADVENLTSPGVEPHDLELTVRQTALIAEADLVVHQDGFQPAVDDAVEQNQPAHVLDATDAVPLVGDDPHFWLDPTRLSKVAEAFAAELADLDPQNAETYRANLETLQTDLMNLDRDFEEGLNGCAVDTVVVSHDAFGYLGHRYGLDIQAISGLSPDAEPSPARVAELRELIESEGITTVFSETLVSPEMAETISADLGIETAVLDPIEGLSDASTEEDYLSLMRKNLAALQDANKCR